MHYTGSPHIYKLIYPELYNILYTVSLKGTTDIINTKTLLILHLKVIFTVRDIDALRGAKFLLNDFLIVNFKLSRVISRFIWAYKLTATHKYF